MSNISQFFKGTGRGGLNPGRNFRRVYKEAGSYTFTAPPTTTEVEINCWGAGGLGSPNGGGGGGGGGGYARFIWTGLTGADTFSLTVGAGGHPGVAGGGDTTAECTSAGQPASPIVGGGGGASGTYVQYQPGPGGTGGVGSGTVPAPLSHLLTTANGGNGGTGPTVSPGNNESTGAGGGGAGSYYGPGGDGNPFIPGQGGGGGSIGIDAFSREGAPGSIFGTDAATEWYFAEEIIGGSGGEGAFGQGVGTPGDGGIVAKTGNFLGGGGGNFHYPMGWTGGSAAGDGGYAGGGGGNRVGAGGNGGPGIIIIYYN